MTQEVSSAIHKTSAVAAAVAAVLSPIPLADELVLFPMFGVLARRIARARGLTGTQIPWRPIGWTAFNGLAARAGLNLAVSFIPGVAAVANATSAVILTEFFGRYVDSVCDHPADAAPVSVASIVSMLKARVRPAGATPQPSS
jgi:uncharacterized protein (DUF697 family)